MPKNENKLPSQKGKNEKFQNEIQKRIKNLDVQKISNGAFSSILDSFEGLINYLIMVGDFKGFRVNKTELLNLLNDSLQPTKDHLSTSGTYNNYEVAGYYLIVKQINNNIELQFQYLLCEQMSNFLAANIIETTGYKYYRIKSDDNVSTEDGVEGTLLEFNIDPNERPMDIFGLGKSYISKVDLDILLSQNENLFISLANIIPGELGYEYGSDLSGKHIALKIEGDSYANVIFGAQPADGDESGESLLPQFFITAPCPPYWDPEFSPGSGTPDVTEFVSITNAGKVTSVDTVQDGNAK